MASKRRNPEKKRAKRKQRQTSFGPYGMRLPWFWERVREAREAGREPSQAEAREWAAAGITKAVYMHVGHLVSAYVQGTVPCLFCEAVEIPAAFNLPPSAIVVGMPWEGAKELARKADLAAYRWLVDHKAPSNLVAQVPPEWQPPNKIPAEEVIKLVEKIPVLLFISKGFHLIDLLPEDAGGIGFGPSTHDPLGSVRVLDGGAA